MRIANRKRLRFAVFLAFACVSWLLRVFAQAGDSVPGRVRLTAEQDHQRLMERLHIAMLRRGPSGDPKAADAANVDESKVPAYPLPDPLVLKNGKKVEDAQTWWKVRRPEIVEEISEQMASRRVELIAARDRLDDDARRAHEASEKERILQRIQDFFGLGEVQRRSRI